MINSPLKYQRHLFWEIEPERIESVLEQSDEWVIARVLHYGDAEDIFDLVDLYGKEKLKYVMDNVPLKPKAKAMAELFYTEYKKECSI